MTFDLWFTLVVYGLACLFAVLGGEVLGHMQALEDQWEADREACS